ncbi:MAG: adenylate/guanylate cyclase domain-containing protein [Spirochaetales bacterium]|nr:adenylate/guanylate cyclase domain-containing protein [Spirochaetales bacterium]
MKKTGSRNKFFKTRNFSFILGLLIVLIILILSQTTGVLSRIETSVTDLHFLYRSLKTGRQRQEGVVETENNLRINPDMVILGVDLQSLDRFGKWPFPRWQHANLLNFFSRISDQNNRESSILLDIFFVEPSQAVEDLLLINAIQENGRVVLETILDEEAPPLGNGEEYFDRQEILYQKAGRITRITGDTGQLPVFYGLQPPLKPYARAASSYGHASFIDDQDQVYRRVHLITRSARLLEEVKLTGLSPDFPLDESRFERLEWINQDNRRVQVKTPLTQPGIEELRRNMEKNGVLKYVDTDSDGEIDESYYVLYKYRDDIIPAAVLTLALKYFNRTFDDLEIVLGKHIKIKQPEIFDSSTGTLWPYAIMEKGPVYDEEGEIVEPGVFREVSEITIPIDRRGRMLINYMGPASQTGMGAYQTFPLRSYAGFAAQPPDSLPSGWVPTRAYENKIIMVGAFEKGIADDIKTTPYGLMYGIEIQANALNTILMENYLTQPPFWVKVLILLALVMLVCFLASRIAALASFFLTLFLILVLFLGITLVFDVKNLVIDFAGPALGMIVAFISVVAYRAMTEERDKKRIKNMFSTYLSPKVVDQIIDQPPELGGLDKNITVFFSDIRGFSTLSESMSPQELVQILNAYLSAMTDVILEYDGTLDKYEGDAIMAFWGAPVSQEDHALLACKAAVRQIEVLKELNKTFPPEIRINIGIGLNTGIMTVGNMGSIQRMDYTLIGDNVNLGARLEGTNKIYGTQIIMSEYTHEMVKEKVIARELDNIRVKGKNRPVSIYELLDVIEG